MYPLLRYGDFIFHIFRITIIKVVVLGVGVAGIMITETLHVSSRAPNSLVKRPGNCM